MNTTRVAITLPRDLLATIDAISNERGLSRSEFITTLIREKISEERDRHIKETYDRVFSEESIRREQLDTARG